MSNPYEYVLSVVIVNWNTCEDLETCLTSLTDRSGFLNLEIIVVDNASEDDSVQMVRSKFPNAILIANQVNLGFAAAVNQGINNARGKYLLILNADIVSNFESIQVLINTLEFRKDVGAVAPRLINLDGSLQRGYYRKLPTLMQILLFYTSLSKFTFKHPYLVKKYLEVYFEENATQFEVEQSPGGCIMIRREVLETVGLMDESFFLFFEDVDWCYRIRKGGWRLLCYNAVSMIHKGGSSFMRLDNSVFYGRFLLSLNQFVDKHYTLWTRLITKLITICDSFIILIIRKFQIIIKPKIIYGNPGKSYQKHKYYINIFIDYYFPPVLSKFVKFILPR
ncbi:MAG: glycosyltransferase family 2 protein [Bacteroidota bacterium]|nr:glycosyltransferase family 2 protein [Bacteroidota bacterium]